MNSIIKSDFLVYYFFKIMNKIIYLLKFFGMMCATTFSRDYKTDEKLEEYLKDCLKYDNYRI